MENLHFEKLNLSYQGKPVLKEKVFDIPEGSFVLVMGPTGGGKSTLLRGMKEQLGDEAFYVSQNPDNGLVRNKVAAELNFNGEVRGYEPDFIRARVAECASYFGISRWLDREVATLSGGEKQLLNIAAAFTVNPKTLILDEPTAMLDPVMADRLIDTIVRLNKEYGTTVIISEHNPDSLYDKADKIIFVMDGEFVVKDKENMARWLFDFPKRADFLPLVTRIFKDKELVFSVSAGRRIADMEYEEDLFAEKNDFGETVLEFKNVCFAYEKNAPILSDVSFEVRAGEVVSLMGENGSGKSTLAFLAAGIKKPYSGKVKRRGDCKMLFQDVTIHFEDGEAYDLSGGERQKLALMSVLKKQPSLLILDEPGKGLDPYEKAALIDKIKAVKAEKTAIIIITHDTDFAAECSDRMLLLHGKNIVKDSSTKEFCRENAFYTTKKMRIFGRR